MGLTVKQIPAQNVVCRAVKTCVGRAGSETDVITTLCVVQSEYCGSYSREADSSTQRYVSYSQNSVGRTAVKQIPDHNVMCRTVRILWVVQP